MAATAAEGSNILWSTSGEFPKISSSLWNIEGLVPREAYNICESVSLALEVSKQKKSASKEEKNLAWPRGEKGQETYLAFIWFLYPPTMQESSVSLHAGFEPRG